MKRIAVVDNEKLKDKEKNLHIQSLCPVNRSGTECIAVAEDGFLTIDEGSCIGCGICVKAAPDGIKIINLPEILDRQPIHRFGENAFALFSLPTPLFGKVVGILGVNGIGKSTAISVIAGLLEPNFGDYEKKEFNYEELIDFFKGTETQLFFEKVRDKEIVMSYKPQKVELLSQVQKGSVQEVLDKVETDKNKDEVIDSLGVSHLLDHDIATLSGGELQRVAIAAAILKKANLYLFDEPTSYLDIKQRINASKYIRKLAEKEENAVLVIEHDLIIFDFISDLANIMYGSESVYGTASGVKQAKNAINVYLSGYLKEENVRFRDKNVTFEPRKPFVAKEKEILVAWKGLAKKQGSFSLQSEEGTIYRGEVIGVLGENGIGKTTFVKMLAKEIKADSGSLDESVKVSYKPQYIESSDELVMTYLQTAVDKYSNQIVNPLSIKPLLMKQLDQLSGGELQRVAIAKCLSEDADLYLLDEPSAYLDVEQRLIISKVIRDFMEITGRSALIVEHDLLFLDYLADKLIVVDGEPAVSGLVKGPYSMKDGMNLFLKKLNITLRRDKESNMPRVNKLDSRLDREQREKNEYYYGK